MLSDAGMKSFVTALLVSAVACVVGCLDADDRSTATDVVDAQPSLVEDEEAAALVAAPRSPAEGACDTVSDPGVAHAPCCGDGYLVYYEWACTLGGWKQVEVGRKRVNCRAPFFGPLEGRTASCKLTDLVECGGGSSCDCLHWSGNCNKPTTPCGVVPPSPWPVAW